MTPGAHPVDQRADVCLGHRGGSELAQRRIDVTAQLAGVERTRVRGEVASALRLAEAQKSVGESLDGPGQEGSTLRIFRRLPALLPGIHAGEPLEEQGARLVAGVGERRRANVSEGDPANPSGPTQAKPDAIGPDARGGDAYH